MRQFIKLLNALWTATTRIAILSAIVTVAVVVCRDIAGDTLLIETISVPRTLERAGLGSDAIATRLRSELTTLTTNAGTSMHNPSVAATGAAGPAAPDVVVPGTGITVGSLSSWISTRVLTVGWRHFLHLPERKTASGEIRQVGNAFRMTLRLNDKAIYETDVAFDEQGIDQELRKAAIELAKHTFPYTYASYLYEIDRGDTAVVQALLDWIIRTYPATDENVIRAHNLRGAILVDQHDYPGAAEEFSWAETLARKAKLPDTYIITNLARNTILAANAEWNIALATQSDSKLLTRAREQYLQQLEQAHGIVSMAVPDGDTHYMHGLIHWQEAVFAASRDAENNHAAAARREFDSAATLADGDQDIFRLRASLLEWDAQRGRNAQHNDDLIISDRRTFLFLAAKAKHHIGGLPEEYTKLAAVLIRQERDIEAHGIPMHGSGSAIVAIAGGAVEPVIPTILTDAVDPSIEASLQRHALLMEACECLRTALRLWNAGDNEAIPDVINELAAVYQASKAMDPVARSCLASPRPWPQTADSQ